MFQTTEIEARRMSNLVTYSGRWRWLLFGERMVTYFRQPPPIPLPRSVEQPPTKIIVPLDALDRLAYLLYDPAHPTFPPTPGKSSPGTSSPSTSGYPYLSVPAWGRSFRYLNWQWYPPPPPLFLDVDDANYSCALYFSDENWGIFRLHMGIFERRVWITIDEPVKPALKASVAEFPALSRPEKSGEVWPDRALVFLPSGSISAAIKVGVYEGEPVCKVRISIN
jgi:hypothetical protein